MTHCPNCGLNHDDRILFIKTQGIRNYYKCQKCGIGFVTFYIKPDPFKWEELK